MSEIKLIAKSFEDCNSELVNDGNYTIELHRLDHNTSLFSTILNILKNKLSDQDITGSRKMIMVIVHLNNFTFYYNQKVSITTPTVTDEVLAAKGVKFDPKSKKVIIALRTISHNTFNGKKFYISTTRLLNVPKIEDSFFVHGLDYKQVLNEGKRIFIEGHNVSIGEIPDVFKPLYEPSARILDCVRVA